MFADVALFPEQASTVAADVDTLYFFIIGITVSLNLRRESNQRRRAFHIASSLKIADWRFQIAEWGSVDSFCILKSPTCNSR